MVSPAIRRSGTPNGERLFLGDQQARHPTPIRRLSLMNEPGDENQIPYASPMGMTIIPPDESSAYISHLDAPSATREVGAEIENSMGSWSARRGGRPGSHSHPIPLQHTPLPPSSALVIPEPLTTKHANSASSKKSRRSTSRYWGENEDPTESEVKTLHARFNAIQVGLGSLDFERARLVEKSKEMEEEKLAMEKQLELRDTEIHALVKRCATQEQKIREFSTVRSQNRELATNLQSMVEKLETMKSSSTNLQDLKRQLGESEHSREELQKRLKWVEKEHDELASTLSECLGNIRKLTMEKQQLEEDRIRERKRSEMELEQQRLNLVQISNDLHSELQQKNQQIGEMQLIIQQQSMKKDTASTMSSTLDSSGSAHVSVLRYDDHVESVRGGSFDSDILDARLKKTVQRYEKHIAEMKIQLESHLEEVIQEEEKKRQEAADEYERQIEWMRKELQETGSNQGRLFELQSKLAEQGVEITREKESSHQVREAAERYEKTILELQAMLEEKTQEVREKNETNMELQAQIARHEMDLQSQVKNVKACEDKIDHLEKHLSEQEQELQSSKETLLKSTKNYEEKVSELETRLREQKEELQSSQDSYTRIKEICGEKEALASTYEIRIAQLQTQSSQQEIELQTKARKIASLESQTRKDLQLKNLLAENETKTTLLQTQMKQKETEWQFTKTEYDSRILWFENELNDQRDVQMALEAENRVLMDTKNDLGGKMNEIVSNYENKVRDLQRAKNEVEARLNELVAKHEKIQDGKTEVETRMKELVSTYEDKMKVLQDAKIEAEIRLSEEVDIKMKEFVSTHEDKVKELKVAKNEAEQRQKELATVHENIVKSLQGEMNQKEKELRQAKDECVNLLTNLKKHKQMHAEQSDKTAGVLSKTEKLSSKLLEMKDKLDEREERIANLESEFAEQMQELMMKQVTLDKVEDQKQQLEAQIETLQHFEDEHSAMVHYIEIMESNCAELTAENGILNVEKESLVEDKNQLQEKLKGFEGRVTTLREQHVAREDEVKEDLKKDLETAKRQLATKTEEVTKVRMEAKLTLENMQVSLGKARDEIVELEDQLGWEKTLQTQPTDASEEIESLTQALEVETRRCEELQEEIALQEQELERRNLELVQSIDEKDREIEKIRAHYGGLEEKIISLENHLRASVADKNTQIESLMSEMKQNNDKQVDLFGKLSDAESKIAGYEAELGRRTEKISILEKEILEANVSSRRISDLEKQIHRFNTDLALKDDEIRDLRMVDLKDAEEEISELKASLETKRIVEQELQSKRSLVLQQQQTVNDLKMSHTRLLTRERDLMEECDRLYNSEREVKEKFIKMEMEQKTFESDLRGKRLSQECELRKLEKEASERNEKLSEVVSLNEGLETRLVMREKELEAERQELDSKRGEITKLRLEFHEKESGLKQQLEEERRNREAVEQTLENIKRQKSDTAKFKKQVSENEKEIEGLKDKVKRQEAYMQKRMKREKLLSRAAAVPAPKSHPAPKTKANAQSLAASHLARRRQSGIPSSSPSTEVAMSTPSIRRKPRASLLPIAGFKSPGFRNDLD